MEDSEVNIYVMMPIFCDSIAQVWFYRHEIPVTRLVMANSRKNNSMTIVSANVKRCAFGVRQLIIYIKPILFTTFSCNDAM